MPPLPAGVTRVTVPVELLPPVTVAGETETEATASGKIESVAVWVIPACVAVIVAEVTLETAVVDTVNVPVVEPAATVTELGTVALVLPEESATTVPAEPAGPFNVTVPVVVNPPVIELGLSDRAESVAGLMVKLP